MFERMRKAVYEYVAAHLDITDNTKFTLDDVYLIWTCKTLQNWKAVLSTNLPDGMIYECTYNGDKDEMYLDSYKKFENICIKNVTKKESKPSNIHYVDESILNKKINKIIKETQNKTQKDKVNNICGGSENCKKKCLHECDKIKFKDYEGNKNLDINDVCNDFDILYRFLCGDDSWFR